MTTALRSIADPWFERERLYRRAGNASDLTQQRPAQPNSTHRSHYACQQVCHCHYTCQHLSLSYLSTPVNLMYVKSCHFQCRIRLTVTCTCQRLFAPWRITYDH